jgi:hypothetical protein
LDPLLFISVFQNWEKIAEKGVSQKYREFKRSLIIPVRLGQVRIATKSLIYSLACFGQKFERTVFDGTTSSSLTIQPSLFYDLAKICTFQHTDLKIKTEFESSFSNWSKNGNDDTKSVKLQRGSKKLSVFFNKLHHLCSNGQKVRTAWLCLPCLLKESAIKLSFRYLWLSCLVCEMAIRQRQRNKFHAEVIPILWAEK